MGRETDVVKSFTLKGQARTEAVARALKDVQTGTERAGKSAGQASGHFTSLAGRMESMNRTMEGARRSLDNFTKVLGGAGLAGLAFGAAKSFGEMVNRAQQLRDVMGNVPFPIEQARKATAGFVSEITLAKASVLAARSGMAASGPEFAKAAEAFAKLGRAAGMDANTAVEQLTGTLAEGKITALDNWGVIVDGEAIYQEYAASVGKTVAELTELEKTTAAQEAGLQAIVKAAAAVKLETDAVTAAYKRAADEAESWWTRQFDLADISRSLAAGLGVEREATEALTRAREDATSATEVLAEVSRRFAAETAGTPETVGFADPMAQFQEQQAFMLAHRRANAPTGKVAPTRPRRGGGRGGQAGPAEDVNRRLDFGFERETEASLQEELFEQELAIIERRKEATEAWFERDHELHQQRLRWMEEEVAARERSAARIMAITDFAANESIANANRVAELTAIAQQSGMLSAEKAAGVQAWLGGFEAAVIAASEAVKAAASFASQNYVQGAAHVAASAFAAVKSALLFGQAASLGAGGGGLHVGAGGDFNFGQGVGPSANDGGPVTPRGPNTDTPTSQGGGPVGPPGGGARPGQRTVVVNLSGVVGDKADVGKFVKEAVLAADQKYGT